MWNGVSVETQCFASLNIPLLNNRGINSPPVEGCPQGGVVELIENGELKIENDKYDLGQNNPVIPTRNEESVHPMK